MGLDAVELVLDLEERFAIEIPDEALSSVWTVADLAAVVMSRLPTTSGGAGEAGGVGGVCGTSRAFYRVRGLLRRHAKLERVRIRPDAGLADLLGGRLRDAWRGIRRDERRVPDLEASESVDAVAVVVVALGFFGAVGVGAWGANWFGAWIGVPLGAMVFFVVGGAAILVEWLSRNRLPKGIVTVGDLARRLAATMLPSEAGGPAESQGERPNAELAVVNAVREAVAKATGLPIDRVKPESELVKDLGIG